MLANTYFRKNERCSRDNIEEGVQGKLSRSTTNLIPAHRRVGLGLCEKTKPGARSREPDVLRRCREQRVGARTEHVRAPYVLRTCSVRAA